MILAKIRTVLSFIERSLLIALFSGMVVMSFAQVILRTFFSAGILWGDIALRHAVVWVAFLGAAIAADQQKHFVIDVIRKILPGRFRHAADMLCSVFAVWCLTYLTAAAVRFWQDERTAETVLFTAFGYNVPAHAVDIIIPSGFILLGIHFLLNAVEQVIALVKGSPVSDMPS